MNAQPREFLDVTELVLLGRSGELFALVGAAERQQRRVGHEVRHDGADEVVYLAEGRGVARNGDEEIPMKKGDVIFSPEGEWHGFWNNSDEPAALIWAWGGAGSKEKAGYEVARPSPWFGDDKEGKA